MSSLDCEKQEGAGDALLDRWALGWAASGRMMRRDM